MEFKPISPSLQQRLEDYLDSSLALDERMEFESRLLSDAGLRLAMARELQLRGAFRAMPAPSLPADARTRLLANTVGNAAKRAHTSARHAPMWMALAVSLAVVGILTSGWDRLPSPSADQQLAVAAPKPQNKTIELSLGEARPLQLAVNSPEDFQRVSFRLQLPDHVGLVDRPGVRELVWEGSLKSGRNLLSLPLVGERTATGALTAHVDVNDFHYTLTVDLSVRQGQGGRQDIQT
jgi:hypothetical protein